MRAACGIYEHPVLSSSEVWAKDALNRSSGATRLFSTLGALTVTAVITVAACQFSGLVDITSVQRYAMLHGLL